MTAKPPVESGMGQGYWDGTSFYCHFVFPKISGTDYYFPTGLFCEGGYYARWPGVCVPFLSPPPTPTCSPNEPGFAVGNPVMVSTGVKIQSEVDPVGGGSFNIARTYRSVRLPLWQPTAGIGWSFSFERQFRVYATSEGKPPYRVDIVTGDGTYIEFRFDNGRYWSASNSADALVPTTEKYDEWTYTSFLGKIDSFKQFDKRFLLVSSLEKEGTGMYFSYDADMKLKSISDSFGRLLEVTWADAYGIGSISAKGSSIKYHYEQQMLTPDRPIPEMIRMLGITLHDENGDMVGNLRYHYEGDEEGPRFFLSGITDANGDRFATYSYDGSGRVLLSEHAGGAERHRFSYEKGRTVVTDPSGAERVFTLNKVARVAAIDQPGGAGCGPAASKLAYDSFGVLASRTDFNNNKTCLKYEPKRPLEIRRIEGLAGTATCPNVNAPVGVGQRVISTKWHPDWKAETRIAEPQKITTYVYNGQPDLDGTVLSCAAGGTLTNGKPVAVLCKKIEQATNDVTGAQGFTAAQVGSAKVWTFSYNRLGQILSETRFGREGSGGDATTYAYYEDSTTSHTLGDLWKTTNPKGHIKEFLEYSPAGLATKIKESNGQLTLLAYNVRHQLIRRVSAAGTDAEQATDFFYDSVGQLVKVTAPDGSIIMYGYDQAHRLTQITDSIGNSISYTLDNAGNRVQEEIRDSTGTLVRNISRTYDALNRLQDVAEGVKQ